jgi:hypothetical protein
MKIIVGATRDDHHASCFDRGDLLDRLLVWLRDACLAFAPTPCALFDAWAEAIDLPSRRYLGNRFQNNQWVHSPGVHAGRSEDAASWDRQSHLEFNESARTRRVPSRCGKCGNVGRLSYGVPAIAEPSPHPRTSNGTVRSRLAAAISVGRWNRSSTVGSLFSSV